MLQADPLVVGEDRDAVEIVLVLARELQFLPGDVDAVRQHVAQVEQHVDPALETDAVTHRLLEFAIVIERELAQHGDGDLIVVDCDADHATLPRTMVSLL
jgi:hypothetical protein